jgi:hypothetical protein
LRAQNGVPDPRGQLGAITKRDGLLAINSSGTGGSIQSMVLVPLPEITARTFYVGIRSDSNKWTVSTNGFTTTSKIVAPPNTAREDFPFTNLEQPFVGRAALTDKLIFYAGTHTVYPNAGHTAPPLLSWDGTISREVVRIPNNINESLTGNAYYIHDLLLDGTQLFIIVHDGDGGGARRSRVFMFDLDTSVLTQVGQSFGPVGDGGIVSGDAWVTTMAMHQGALYVGTGEGFINAGTTGKVYRIRPGVDTAWTLDGVLGISLAAYETPLSMASYGGQLYVGTEVFLAAVGNLYVRSPLGAYTVARTTGGAPGGFVSGWGALQVFGANLYATRFHSDGANSQTSIMKYDGTSWTTPQIVQTGLGGGSNPIYRGSTALVYNGSLYFLFLSSNSSAVWGQMWSSSDGTTWASTVSNLSPTQTSIFGVLAT